MNTQPKRRAPAKPFLNSEKKIIDLAILLAILSSLIWIFFAPGRGILHYRQVQKDIDNLTLETQSLTEQNNQLRQEINELQNNTRLLEEIARRKYGLLKPNEMVFIFNPAE